MLMVNPERRATIEEISGHWWLNWGYQDPLLVDTKSGATSEQNTSLPGAPPSSPAATGLASVASWLRRTSRPLLENGSKVRCLLRSQAAAGGDVVRQRSLRRSRKENNVSQTVQQVVAVDARPYKSILKRRNSIKQKPATVVEIHASPPSPAAIATALPPRKGILKKPTEESGYYSSSPENSDSGLAPPTQQCPSAPTHRKGILKRNGKFSSADQHDFGSLDQLAAPRSRPSGAISEDSILSSESFDQLDLPDRVAPPPSTQKAGKPGMRGCVSADNLLDIQEYCSLDEGLLRPWSCYKAGVADSAFSISDCDNVTEAYKQALVLRGPAPC